MARSASPLRPRAAALSLLACLLRDPSMATVAPSVQDPPAGPPNAVIDLRTSAGVGLVRGQWRYSDVEIVTVDSRGVGPDLRPSGDAIKTYDYRPKAGVAGFDDSAWPVIAPEALRQRRATGKLCFNWYRIAVTIPPRIAGFDPTGSTVAFEVVVDDYAEVWVNGALPVVLGQAGGAVVKGFNAPNRVVVGRNVRPGDRIELAVFGMNGPISASPDNFIWIKSATLDFYAPRAAAGVPAQVTRLDPALDAIVPAHAAIEKLAGGFLFTEGPVWVSGPAGGGGYLLFSDPNNNVIHRWTSDGELSIYRTKSGYAGADIGEYHQPGSNGLTLDREGRLTIAQHGERRIIRLERNGEETVLADRVDGKRLNSPNDLVYRSDGALYFTDPPFGLPQVFADPRRELAVSGVYRAADGAVQLVASDLKAPNGIAFSPDERHLYVGDWDEQRKVVMRYPVLADGSLGGGEVFADLTAAPGEDAIDGVKVDQRGNVYVSGPGGLWIFSPAGTPLGMVVAPEHPHNLAWGDADGRTLYLTAETGLYRLRLNVAGVRP